MCRSLEALRDFSVGQDRDGFKSFYLDSTSFDNNLILRYFLILRTVLKNEHI